MDLSGVISFFSPCFTPLCFLKEKGGHLTVSDDHSAGYFGCHGNRETGVVDEEIIMNGTRVTHHTHGSKQLEHDEDEPSSIIRGSALMDLKLVPLGSVNY